MTLALPARVSALLLVSTAVARADDVEIEVEATPVATPAAPKWWEVLDLRVSGYVQPQVVFSDLSEDEVSVEGAPLNQDRFLVRRARVKVERWFKYARTSVELDLNTVDGPHVSPSGAELSLFLPNARGDRPPLVGVTAGLFDIPFGFELPEDSDARYFAERSLGSRALFPGDNDVGVQLASALGPIRLVVAVQNGVPLRNTPDDALAYTARKTILGRLGAVAGVEGRTELAGGVSYLNGGGFHAGTPESKSTLLWSDRNQNGLVSLDELVGVSGQAASPSSTFEQWAVNADIQVGLHTPLGWTRVFAEATMASNLDRGWLVADPVSTGYDVREIAWTAGAVQEVTRYGVLGFRADFYDPNSDVFESRRGDFVPTDVSVLTLSPMVAAQLPGFGRLVLQYDYVVDHLGRDDLGVPRDLANDQWTLRGQVEF
ncbi:MAG: hypothetical protein V4850_22855 [Myxococcota bacterium]